MSKDKDLNVFDTDAVVEEKRALGLKTVLNSRHAKIFDKTCLICAHTDRDVMEELYVEESQDIDAICEAFGVDVAAFKLHCRALGYDMARTKNTYRVLHLLMEDGIKQVRDGNVKMSAKELMRVIQHIDKREGRIIERTLNERPTTVIFASELPRPGAFEGETIQGQLAPHVFQEPNPLGASELQSLEKNELEIGPEVQVEVLKLPEEEK